MIGQKIKNVSLYSFLPENLENIRSTHLYDAPLEGSTFFIYRRSTNRTPLDSSGLADFKYAFFSWTGRNTKRITAFEPYSIDYL